MPRAPEVRAEWFAVVRIWSKIGVDGYEEAALKLLTLVLLLVGKRTLGPKTAKLRQPRCRESPSTLSNRQAGTAVTSGAAHRECANESEATSTIHPGLPRNRVPRSSNSDKMAPDRHFLYAAGALSRYQMTLPRNSIRRATMAFHGSRWAASIKPVRS